MFFRFHLSTKSYVRLVRLKLTIRLIIIHLLI
nr:MAG TPA: hypothetical protein [Caudoviricetes sp.]